MLGAQVVLLLSFLFLNGMLFRLFAVALDSSESSLAATVVANAANFLFTAVLGHVLFKEVLFTASYLTGAAFMLMGMFLIVW